MSFYKSEPTQAASQLIADVNYDEQAKRYKISLYEVSAKLDTKGRFITNGIVVNPSERPNVKKYKTQGEALLAAHKYADQNEGVRVSHKLFPILHAV